MKIYTQYVISIIPRDVSEEVLETLHKNLNARLEKYANSIKLFDVVEDVSNIDDIFEDGFAAYRHTLDVDFTDEELIQIKNNLEDLIDDEQFLCESAFLTYMQEKHGVSAALENIMYEEMDKLNLRLGGSLIFMVEFYCGYAYVIRA